MYQPSQSIVSLACTLFVSSTTIAVLAAYDWRRAVTLICALTLGAIVWAALNVRRQHTAPHAAPQQQHSRFSFALSDMSEIYTLTLLWCAISMFLMYSVSGLNWRHGWQYALGFLGFAMAHGSVVLRLLRGSGAERQALTSSAYRDIKIEAMAVASALAWFLATEKLWTRKDDWGANDIFLSGGAALLVLAACLYDIRRRTTDT